VERTFPVHSPTIAKIEVATLGDVRRAKLYYLRERHGKAAKIKERRVARGKAVAEAAVVEDEEVDQELLDEAELDEEVMAEELDDIEAVGDDEGAEDVVDDVEAVDAEDAEDAEEAADE
jgi:hypothetical protein